MALVGESGSGKSVTANAILKLLPKHSAVFNRNCDTVNLLNCSERKLRGIRGSR